METLVLRHKSNNSRGFTLLEVMMAIVILTVGLLGVAALISKTSGNTSHSRYMSLAGMLASEKLEDLNRYPTTDPAISFPAGSTTVGSLTADTSQSVTVGAVTETVDYYDQVQMSGTTGSVSETIKGVNTSGTTTYTTVTHTPDGTASEATTTTAPTALSGADPTTFRRRWIIEKDAPVKGVRRITVLVTLQNLSGAYGVTFQMSMVRPWR
jgi:prepilin-type N-terminal cleavage/methylation domain-containing protein